MYYFLLHCHGYSMISVVSVSRDATSLLDMRVAPSSTTLWLLWRTPTLSSNRNVRRQYYKWTHLPLIQRKFLYIPLFWSHPSKFLYISLFLQNISWNSLLSLCPLSPKSNKGWLYNIPKIHWNTRVTVPFPSLQNLLKLSARKNCTLSQNTYLYLKSTMQDTLQWHVWLDIYIFIDDYFKTHFRKGVNLYSIFESFNIHLETYKFL